MSASMRSRISGVGNSRSAAPSLSRRAGRNAVDADAERRPRQASEARQVPDAGLAAAEWAVMGLRSRRSSPITFRMTRDAGLAHAPRDKALEQ